MKFARNCAVYLIALLFFLKGVEANGKEYEFGAPPDSPVAEDKLKKKLVEIVEWLERETMMSVDELPPIVFLPLEIINYMAFFPDKVEDNSSQKALAIYIGHEYNGNEYGTIILPDTFKLGRDDYMLLHEMVHHFQHVNDKRGECGAEDEREAYILQHKYVTETGRGQLPDPMLMVTLNCGRM